MDSLVTYATITGRVHRSLQQNGQDSTFAGRAGESAFGLVLDGCGSKAMVGAKRRPSSNEVGARLLGQFMAASLAKRLRTTCPLPALLPSLYQDSLDFLRELLSLMPMSGEEKGHFLASHLLCTVVGFVVTPDAAAYFWRGDGFLMYNGAITCLDNDNTPRYLAYDLLEGANQDSFETRILERGELTWLAVATDGWQPESLAELEIPRPPLALQRWLNVQGRRPGYFNDDGAVSAWYGNGHIGHTHEQ